MRDRYIQDTRIHCCLYFINPTGHALRAIDVIVMKKLSEVVNVVPVIAKADSLTLEEREAFKQKVHSPFGYSAKCRVVDFVRPEVLIAGLVDFFGTCVGRSRSARSCSTIASVCIRSTRKRTTRRRCNSTRASGCVLFDDSLGTGAVC